MDILTQQLNRDYLADEAAALEPLLERARTTPELSARIQTTAAELVRNAQHRRRHAEGLQAFLQHYDLSSEEGVILMCLAESLLRIPDAATVDELIADKLSSADWHRHLGQTDSLFVNASTWALMLTGKVLKLGSDAAHDPLDLVLKLAARMEEPLLRASLRAAMKIMAHEFVMGRSIGEALERSRSEANRRWRYSFDMLGEAALCAADAARYQDAYLEAIHRIGQDVDAGCPDFAKPGISIKFSALCPRFEYAHRARAVAELSQRLAVLARGARRADIAITVDAEEAERLEITLAAFEAVFRSADRGTGAKLGIAVQAYQKRALRVLGNLERLAAQCGREIPVRLVKGAYWDTEVKRAQEQGLRDYPVFTRKVNTDISYLACARFLLEECPHIYPQFATHNAHTVSYVYHHAGERAYEFQRLHGMGEDLYGGAALDLACRVYAPVGAHDDLLPYLVRRLLENGANTSFVNQMAHGETAVEEIILDPVAQLAAAGGEVRHPGIPLPSDLYLPARVNSQGINFADAGELSPLQARLEAFSAQERQAVPIVDGKPVTGEARHPVLDPARPRETIGVVEYAGSAGVAAAVTTAAGAFEDWRRRGADARAAILERAADLYEAHRADLAALCVREAGKTLKDSHDDVREAIDFLRYYADQCRRLFAAPAALPAPTGESNRLYWQGRGVFLCISPWNFPVAIYTGQIAAALAAGNTVIAKPAEQTTLTAAYATQLLHRAGVPDAVLAFLPGDGAAVGALALADPRIAGVAFTGSLDTARAISRRLAAREGPLATLIAETGGLNAMLVDSSALPEQVVRDVAHSAFNSAGQRCSALRVLYLQHDVAPRILDLLTGFMDEWVVGDPGELATDMGPVIDEAARSALETHIDTMARSAKLLYRGEASGTPLDGYFVAPAIIEVEDIGQLPGEVFGPVLHVIRYQPAELDAVIAQINTAGYGLTLGIHSRITRRAEYIRARVRVGNVYVNRNMVGAVVGAQPFGGCGLSGTGPKAGGPHYVQRFAVEQTYTVNTAAVGGNAALLAGQ